MTDNAEIMDIHRIAWEQKEKYLLSLTEDDFRDLAVRPVFGRSGLRFVRDTCGIDEQGKDCIFVGDGPLDELLIYVVQTKRGHLNMSGKATENLITAQTQVAMALATEVVLTDVRVKRTPDVVILCASGRINEAARNHIQGVIKDNRIRFRDSNDLIPLIDDHYPEFWYGINASQFPYLRQLREELLRHSDTITVADQTNGNASPIVDDAYVTLYLSRITPHVRRDHGEAHLEPKLEQIPTNLLLQQPHQQILITGEGGSGKTTALRRIAYQLTESALAMRPNARIPVVLRSLDIARSDASLVQLIQSHIAEISKQEGSCFELADFRDGIPVVLIDALDEVGDDDLKNVLLDRIGEFYIEFPKCTVVLTSRDYAFIAQLPALKNYARYHLSDINLSQAAKIVDRVSAGGTIPKEAAKEVLRQLQDVHGVSLNPLLVTVFVATSDFSKKDIPPNITEIFKKFTEQMLGRWDERKGLSQQYQAPLKDFLLSRVAYAMHVHRITSIPISEFRALIVRELQDRGYEADAETLTEEILFRSGLFRAVDDEVAFRHHLLQEFFAGRGAGNSKSFEPFLADEWWRKAIIFYFGENASRHDELRELASKADRYTAADGFQAAVTIGLAAQACYLATLQEKLETFEWVVETLSRSSQPFVEDIRRNRHFDFPLSAFVYSFLMGRDAVATDPIQQVLARLVPNSETEPSSDMEELRAFWCITGLIESHHIDKAEPLIRGFKPKDERLLLAIHLSCFMIANARFSVPEHKRIAKRIVDRIGPKIVHLTGQVLSEWRSMLLEMHRGEVRAIQAVDEKTSGASRGPYVH